MSQTAGQLTGMSQATKPTGPILAIVITMLGYLVAGMVPIFFGVTGEDMTSFRSQFILTASFAGWIAVIFCWVKFKEGRPIASLGFPAKGALQQIMLGALVGLGFTSLIVGVNILSGNATLGGFQATNLGPALILLLGFVIQGTAEEIAFRGYLVQAFAAKWSLVVAIVVQALLFTSAHIANGLHLPSILCMVAVSYFLAMWVLASGNLWAVMAFHAIWNWSQGNFWGSAVSNIQVETSLFHFDTTGSPLLSGGSFGLEASYFTIALLTLAGIFFHRRWLSKSAPVSTAE